MMNPNRAAPTFVVVKLKTRDAAKTQLLKIGINVPNIGYVDPHELYVRHGLETCSRPIHVEGPLSTGEIEVSWAVAHRSVAYSFADLHHYSKYFIADFSQPRSRGYHRDFPLKITITNVLLVDEKIYIFGYEKAGVMSAYTSDVNRGTWEPLSLPITNDYRFIAVSLGKKILAIHVDYQCCSVYDPQLREWNSVDYKGLLHQFCSIVDYPMTVEEHNTFYWLDQEANIRAFDYQLCKHYVGPIVGFAHEPIVRGREPGAATLLHFTAHLFGLVWMKDDFLHLTFLNVSTGPKARSTSIHDHHLFVNVLACVHRQIPYGLVVDGAFKL